jgi:hypothetical protein
MNTGSTSGALLVQNNAWHPAQALAYFSHGWSHCRFLAVATACCAVHNGHDSVVLSVN